MRYKTPLDTRPLVTTVLPDGTVVHRPATGTCDECGTDVHGGDRCPDCIERAAAAAQAAYEASLPRCAHCTHAAVPYWSRRYCGEECRRLADNARRRARYQARPQPHERECIVCGTSFTPKGPGARYCTHTTRCRVAAHRARRRAAALATTSPRTTRS